MSKLSPAIIAITSVQIDTAVLSQALNKVPSNIFKTLPTSYSDLIAICHDIQESFEKSLTELLRCAEKSLARLGTVPEQLIYIYYYSFDRISPKDQLAIPGFKYPPNLIKSHSTCVFASPQMDILPNIYEIQACVPSMDQLQTTPNYRLKRNGVLMWLPLTVTTEIEDTGITQDTPAFGFPVWLPQPIVGLHTIKNGTVAIGEFVSRNNRDDITNYFGRLGGKNPDDPDGQVRWYSFMDWQAIQIGDLSKFNFLPVDNELDLARNGLICLPDAIAKAAAAIRQKGKRVGVRSWEDDGARFRVPIEPGFVIIWRDDIPSIPVPFGLDNLAESVIEALANQIWFWSSFGNKNIPISYPLGTGESVLLGVSQVSAAVNNYLSGLLGNQELSIDFAFLVGKPVGSQFDLIKDMIPAPFLGTVSADLTSTDSQAVSLIQTVLKDDNLYTLNQSSMAGGGLVDNSQTRPASLTVLPDIAPEGISNFPDRTFQIQLAASLKISKNLPQPRSYHVRLGPVVSFKPYTINLPSVAIFFTDANFSGFPLIVMPKDTFNLSGKWDWNNYPSLIPKRDEVCSRLEVIKTALDVVSFFNHDNTLKLFRKAIGCIDAWLQTVIDARGDISDLNGDTISGPDIFICGISIGGSSFNDHISSMIMIGPPRSLGGAVLTCYEDDRNYNEDGSRRNGGRFIQFGIRDKTFINAVPDFSDLSKGYSLSGTAILLPMRLDSNSQITEFNDRISSITFS